ncbi:MAG: aspartate-semialdehyde dehydrogenase [Eubacterium sp.]|jgi:aspartate-semialdehyde dehydrogenase|nr:aspartate-semialdehyde dehydrogenase [Eubacterium sp.]
MGKYNVGIIGATGMVGQRFALILENHPWFEVTALSASPRSKGKTYAEATRGRWLVDRPVPEKMKDMTLFDATEDIDAITKAVDFVFCAVDMPKEETKALEEAYAKKECPVMSNNSANRATQDVPMIIPEVNADHAAIVEFQRKRLGTNKGFIAVKSNCSIQSYVPALHPLMGYGIEDVLVCTYQAISGAGRTFDTWPEMEDNVIPFIGGEEEKSEREPLKIWGKIENNKIIPAKSPNITTQCIRVPVSNGHMAAVFVRLREKLSKGQITAIWSEYKGEAQRLNLPTAPKQFLNYFEEDNFPQTKLHRDLENGMAVSLGRLREDSQYDYKFVGLSHNTMRGAAGGAVLMAELFAAKGFFGG